MPSFDHPFRRLQWKLTFSYAWITLTTLGLLMVVGLGVGSELAAANFSHLAVEDLQVHASEVIPYLSSASPDRAGIARWLQQAGTLATPVVLLQMPQITYTVTMTGFRAVVDQQGVVLASRGPDAVFPGTPLAAHLPQSARAVLHAALLGRTDASQLVATLSHATALVAYPLFGPAGRMEGVLVAETTDLSQPVTLLKVLVAGVVLTLPVAILAALIGTLFGFLTARGFSHRFQRLSWTVEQWGEGNFTQQATDASGDELGQLTGRLNLLAEQFQALLASRQQLATLQERQRLARDLHDSVKQQVFGISMLVQSAKSLLRQDLDRAQICLDETEHSVEHVQQELTTLVHALRPTMLETHGLGEAISELTTHWEQQSGIATQIRVTGAWAPSGSAEETLFRVAQEALANVARHSRATQVRVTLTDEQDCWTLQIDDNGQGFVPATVPGTGMGLRSMQERLQAVGGTLLVDSTPGQGTHLLACCPAVVREAVAQEGAAWSR